MDFSKQARLAALGLLVASACGCVSYTGLEYGASDDMVDEQNRPYAEEAQRNFSMRGTRNVTLTEAEEVAVFMSNAQDYHRGAGYFRQPDEVCKDVDVRRQLLVYTKGKIGEEIGKLADFRLVEQNDEGVVISQGAGSSLYTLTYSIDSLHAREHSRYVTQDAYDKRGRLVRRGGETYFIWAASASVKIGLTAPDGKVAFTLTGNGEAFSDSTMQCMDLTLLEKAVEQAIDAAMRKFAVKFAPPIYVVQTCQGGQFAKLSVGSNYGLRQGQRVEFFSHKPDGREYVTGSGVVAHDKQWFGLGGTTPNPDMFGTEGVWVFVEGFDAKHPETRRVFINTSARIK